MKAKFTLAVPLAILLASAVANAAAGCGPLPLAVADGRIGGPITIDSTNDVSIVFWVTQGHSYSVEVVATNDNASVTNLIVGNSYCPTSNAVTLTFTTTIDPSLGAEGVGTRASFTATVNGFLEARVGVLSGSYPLTYKIADTTLYNPRWSTSGGFQTSWGFHNTTGSSISGTLKVYGPSGSLITTVGPFAIAPHQTVFKVTGTDVIAPNSYGSAEFTNTGPPGAIQADAYYYNSNFTVLVPSLFSPARSGP
jgi:hypothetical protein